MNTREKNAIDRWSRRVQDFTSLPTESGARYPAALSAWVHELETNILEERTKPTRSDSVLDLGAGGGRFSSFFASRCGRVTAVEPSDLINVLRTNTASFTNIEYLHQRIQDSTFAGEFTIALISGVLLNMTHEEVKLCLCLAAKALKPGGLLALREPVARGGIVNVDWKYYPQGSEPHIRDDMYFEYYRDVSFYRDTCALYGLRHTETTISHAPVFYFLPNAMPMRAQLQNVVPYLLRASWSKNFMKTYDAIMKHPYAFIMDLLKKKTMRLHFFVKERDNA